MKRRWVNFLKDYLTFSSRERNGIFVILLLCVLTYFIPRFLPVNKPRAEKGAFQKELAKLKISIDTSRNAYANQHEDFSPDYYRPRHYDNASLEGELFAFDPNTLEAAGWKRLGVREKTITTIHNFIAKGYKFRQPNDIRKIYGLRSQDADRLVPYVQIAGKETFEKSASENHNYPAYTKKPEVDVYRPKIIDINTADTAVFISLPGIGSKLAARIVNFRQKLGGFSTVAQLAETYGIPDSTFQNIKGRLQCLHPELKKMNINTIDANELKTHPYIKWNIANAIVNYRSQHGNYKSLEDLHKIEIITDEVFNKIAPYLVL